MRRQGSAQPRSRQQQKSFSYHEGKLSIKRWGSPTFRSDHFQVKHLVAHLYTSISSSSFANSTLPGQPTAHFSNMSFLRTLFFRKKRAPLACTMDLDEEGHHVHLTPPSSSPQPILTSTRPTQMPASSTSLPSPSSSCSSPKAANPALPPFHSSTPPSATTPTSSSSPTT